MRKSFLLNLVFVALLLGCKGLDDDMLTLQRKTYTGNLRLDGYYYEQSENRTFVYFLYKDGIMLYTQSFSSLNLLEVESIMIDRYDDYRKDKISWGIFVVESDTCIIYESWSTSVGGGLPTFKCIGNIENDTTFRFTKTINSDGREFEENDVYHFRQFNQKPDSINNFIK